MGRRDAKGAESSIGTVEVAGNLHERMKQCERRLPRAALRKNRNKFGSRREANLYIASPGR